MTPNPTNFTEASLAQQVFAEDEEVAAEVVVPVPVTPELRPLKWDELVRRGDFVKNGQKGFEPWEGPAGFRADAFVKTIYRPLPSAATKKSQ